MATRFKSSPLLFIFITVCIDAIGLGIIIPVLPDLLIEVTGEGIGSAARWGGLLTASYAIMQFLCGPLLGSLSDRYGRRRILLLGLIALAIDYVVMSLASTLSLLVLTRLLAGAAGSTHVTAKAYIADISTADKRAANFGVIGAAFGIGFILGPVLGGLLGELGTRAPFVVAALLALLNCIYGYFVLPESLPVEKRRAFSWAKSNPFSGILLARRFPSLGWIFLSLLLFSIAHQVYPAVWSYWGHAAFNWSSFEIGLSLALVGIGYALAQGLLIRRILSAIGESKTAYVGFTLTALSMLFFGFASNELAVYLLLPLVALGAIVTPALEGILSNTVPENEQGLLQGVSSGLVAIATIISPLVMTQVFYVYTDAAGTSGHNFPGAPFILAAVLTALAMIAFWFAVGNGKDVDAVRSSATAVASEPPEKISDG